MERQAEALGEAAPVSQDEADQPTLSIAKDSHKVVNTSATIPSLGGAVLTSAMAK